jgi:hypothetical protein
VVGLGTRLTRSCRTASMAQAELRKPPPPSANAETQTNVLPSEPEPEPAPQPAPPPLQPPPAEAAAEAMAVAHVELLAVRSPAASRARRPFATDSSCRIARTLACTEIRYAPTCRLAAKRRLSGSVHRPSPRHSKRRLPRQPRRRVPRMTLRAQSGGSWKPRVMRSKSRRLVA